MTEQEIQLRVAQRNGVVGGARQTTESGQAPMNHHTFLIKSAMGKCCRKPKVMPPQPKQQAIREAEVKATAEGLTQSGPDNKRLN